MLQNNLPAFPDPPPERVEQGHPQPQTAAAADEHGVREAHRGLHLLVDSTEQISHDRGPECLSVQHHGR